MTQVSPSLGGWPTNDVEGFPLDTIHLWTCQFCNPSAQYVCKPSRIGVQFLRPKDQENLSPESSEATQTWENGQGSQLQAPTMISFWSTHFQVGADIHTSQRDAGMLEDCGKRQNHKKAKVDKLLEVPCYADLLDEDGDESDKGGMQVRPQALVVKSHTAWQRKMAKWVQEEQNWSEDDDDNIADTVYGYQQSKWLPQSLDLLFGGHKEMDIEQQMQQIRRQQAYIQEAQLMELLADEEVDKHRIPDDGELEGLGDDFEG